MYNLHTNNLSKHFGGVYAVNNLNLKFKVKKITGIIGPNGSGKSTLTNLLTGVFQFDNGSVTIEGVKAKRIKSYDLPELGITRTFQDIRLFEQMSVLDNLLITLTKKSVFDALFSKHNNLHLQHAQIILKDLRLWEKRNQLAQNLSYGQRKLLEIGRVIAMDKKIILLDEPFAGLFKEVIKIIVSVIKKQKEQGKTIILIEHNMELIRELCDYLYVLDEGQLLAEGLPNKILSEKKSNRSLFGRVK